MADDEGMKRREALQKLRERRTNPGPTPERPAAAGGGAAGAGGGRAQALREFIAKRKGGETGGAGAGAGRGLGRAAGGGLGAGPGAAGASAFREKLKERIAAGQGGAQPNRGGGGLAKLLANGGGKGAAGALREKLGGAGADGAGGGGGLRDKLAGGPGGAAKSRILKQILAKRGKGGNDVDDAEIVEDGEDAVRAPSGEGAARDPDWQRRQLRERIRKLQAKLDELDLEAMDDDDLIGGAGAGGSASKE